MIALALTLHIPVFLYFPVTASNHLLFDHDRVSLIISENTKYICWTPALDPEDLRLY